MLASLNHPNIAQIHGIEKSDDTQALVLELVEGPTLADRIAKGPIPLDEALPIAKQIAEALEAAHEAGVIHRDLKPANIKVREDGTVKVLDFGLAKVLDAAPAGDPDESPTLTAAAATQQGVILGTAAYMSPEQAKGKPADRRADIWAFGCVLYEMLTGTRPFEGGNVSEVLAEVIKSDPNWEAFPDATPATLRQVVRRCLQKDPKQRLHDVADVRLAMEGAFETTLSTPSSPIVAPPPAGMERAIPLKLAVAALVVATIGTWWATRPALPEPQPSMRLEARLSGLGSDEGAQEVVLSPDGTRLVYSTTDPLAPQASGGMYVRALDQLEGTLLVPGRANNPFFSPDSQWVGFFADGELRKVPVAGGASQTVAPAGGLSTGSWGPDETIIFGSLGGGLSRVSANGGEPEVLTPLEEGEIAHASPQLLPGGQAVLFTSKASSLNLDSVRLEVLDLETRERKVVHEGSEFGRYVPTGHLVYVVDNELFAVPFDLAALDVVGSAIPILSGIDSGGDNDVAVQPFSVAPTGTLAYLADSGGEPEYPVVWVDRQGNTTPLWDEHGEYGLPRLSPDGTRLALVAHRNDNVDIWIYDIERGTPTRLTFDAGRDDDQTWSPDGQYLAFGSARDQSFSMYRVRADGSGEVERLAECDADCFPFDWSPDGRFLAYGEVHPENFVDIWVLPLQGERQPQVFLNRAGVGDNAAAFSPNGRWMAYESSESGSGMGIYVRPYPPAPGQWSISSDGGTQPRWSADGRELFYRTDSGIMVVAVEADADVFSFGPAEELFTGAFQGGASYVQVAGEPYLDYDVAPDGQRFVMFPRSEDDEARNDHVTLVFNWFEELKARVPVP